MESERTMENIMDSRSTGVFPKSAVLSHQSCYESLSQKEKKKKKKIVYPGILVTLDSKINKCRKCKLLYLVRWAGYEGTDEETSWLPASELGNAPDLLQAFHAAYPHKPGPLS